MARRILMWSTSMSMTYTVGDREVWHHSQAPSLMFCGQIPLMERLVDRPTGFVDTGWDEVRIDPSELRAFLPTVFEYLRLSGSLPLRAMVRGFVLVALFLDHQASGDWYPVPPGFDDITAELHLIVPYRVAHVRAADLQPGPDTD